MYVCMYLYVTISNYKLFTSKLSPHTGRRKVSLRNVIVNVFSNFPPWRSFCYIGCRYVDVRLCVCERVLTSCTC